MPMRRARLPAAGPKRVETTASTRSSVASAPNPTPVAWPIAPQLRAAGFTDPLVLHALVTAIGDRHQAHQRAEVAAHCETCRVPKNSALNIAALEIRPRRASVVRVAARCAATRSVPVRDAARRGPPSTVVLRALDGVQVRPTRAQGRRPQRRRHRAAVARLRRAPVRHELPLSSSRMPCVASNAWIRLRTRFDHSRPSRSPASLAAASSASGDGTCTTLQTFRSPPGHRRSRCQ